MYRIQDLSEKEKPRERLGEHGPEELETSELLAVILGTGTQREGVLELSQRVLTDYGKQTIRDYRSVERVKQDFGLSHVKACQVLASLEIGRRLFTPQNHSYPAIRSAEDVWNHVSEMGKFQKEHVRGLYLNTRNILIHDEIIAIGSVDKSLAHPREIFLPAISHSAAALILVHNHPSGETTPSPADRELTQNLTEAGKLLQIQVLDHIVVTASTYRSLF